MFNIPVLGATAEPVVRSTLLLLFMTSPSVQFYFLNIIGSTMSAEKLRAVLRDFH